MVSYDSLVTQVDEFGFYQRCLFASISVCSILSCFNTMSIVFLAASPNHWCTVPSLDQKNWTQELKWNLSLPYKDGEYSKCQVYDVNYTGWSLNEALDFLEARDVSSLKKVPCLERDGWTYDRSQYLTSIVTQWDLVCDNRWLKSLAKSATSIGLLIGVMFFGILSDTYGRKKAFITGVILLIIFAILEAFSPNMIIFLLSRLIIGAANGACYIVSFVIVVELVGPEWRTFTGIAVAYYWAIGYIILAGIAYLIRDWFRLQLVCGIPCIAMLGYIVTLPESPRWLYAKARHEEADKIIRTIAKVNKASIPDNLKVTVPASTKAYPWDPLRTPRMRLRSLNIFFNWFVNSLVYFGLSLNSSNLGGNDYINFLISGAVEFPATLFCQISLKYLGRRWPLSASMFVCGLALLATIAVPKELNIISIALAMIGKFFICASYTIIYVFSAELFPTTVRSVGVSSGSFWARIGGIIAPFIAQLSEYGPWVPLFIFGVFSLLAGIFALFLPETKGRELPENLPEGENFGGPYHIPRPFFSFTTRSTTNKDNGAFAENLNGKSNLGYVTGDTKL